MAERRTDKSSVYSHLGHSSSEVVTVLVAVLCDPRGKQFLKSRERSRGEHLGAEGIGLQLLKVGLYDY